MQRHEDLQSLAAGYALSALEPDEAAAFEEHVASCPRCAELLAEMRALVGAMPLTVPQVAPPPELKARLLEAIRAEADASQEPRTVAGPAPASQRPWFARPMSLVAVAAALLFALAGTAAWAFTLQDRLDTSQRRLATLYDAMTVLAEADQSWDFSGSTIEPGARGILAYSSQHRASMLMVWGLPPESEDENYVAWSSVQGDRQGAGAMRKANGGMWALVEGDVADMDSVGITLRSAEGAQPVDVVEVALRTP